MYKYLAISFTFAIFCSCQAQKTALETTQATQQNWGGGAAGSGSGTAYKITFKADKPGTYSFNYLYNNHAIMPLRHYTAVGKADSVIIMKAGETVQLSADEYFPGEVDRRTGRDSFLLKKQAAQEIIKASMARDIPLSKGAEGVVCYTCNGKKYFLQILKFNSLTPINYP